MLQSSPTMWQPLQLSIPNQDRISALPDSILYHVLSFLTTKDGAATSIISKRWKPLWLSQLFLRFDDQPFQDALTFSNFVNSFIANRDKTLPILSFHLKCCFLNRDIHDFLYTAVNKGVENLTIDLCNSGYSIMTLPSFILSTKTLSVLKLNRITLNEIPYFYLPSLKVLHLNIVKFRYYEYLLKLLSGCPILQDLETDFLMVYSPYSKEERQIISLSNLITANICNVFIPTEFDWFHNVERLRVEVWISIYTTLLNKYS